MSHIRNITIDKDLKLNFKWYMSNIVKPPNNLLTIYRKNHKLNL